MSSQTLFRKIQKLMGNAFEISVYAHDQKEADYVLNEAVLEIQRIEALLTTFNDASQTNKINQAAGVHPVVVDREVFELIKRAQKISVLTQGAFDLSYGSIDKRLWNFDQHMDALPDTATAKKMIRLINYENIILNELDQSVFLKEKGMCIGFGAIGKGYAADKAKQKLQQLGVKSGIVNASGDLSAWGYQSDGKPWTIGIADPNTKSPFGFLSITNTAVATSGNYEKFATINGKKYSHTINPKTGMPVTGIKSVTIISPHAEISDALATPVTVMGTTVGVDLINQLPGIGCIIIDDDDQLHTSKNINLKKNKQYA